MSDRPHVLIVDDDHEITHALTVRLRAADCEVCETHDGDSGLKAVKEQSPDVIILDIRMPGCDGLTFLARLQERKRTKVIPVIVLSANASDKAQALEAGAYCFISKPYQGNELMQAVETSLKTSAALWT